MPKRAGIQQVVENEQSANGQEQSGSGAVSIWVKDQADAGMHEIERRLRERWHLAYDRPELLRLITQVAIQLIEHGLVMRVGLHFALGVLPTANGRAAAAPPPTEGAHGRTRGHAVWVGGVTMAGLHWIQEWLQAAGYLANRSDVLELAVDLTLQAFDADLLLQPKGPQVTVIDPRANRSSDKDRASGPARE